MLSSILKPAGIRVQWIPIFSILFCFSTISAQDLEDPIRIKNPIPGDEITAVPEVASFHRFNHLPTNLYTGTAEITIPIFTIKSGNISIPINLSYDARGLKVDEYAPSTGMGWNLTGAGSISKVVKDIEDFDVSFGSWSEPDDDYGIITESYLASMGSKVDIGDYQGIYQKYSELPGIYGSNIPSLDISGSTYLTSTDASPDHFIASAPGLSTSFVLEESSTDVYQPKEINPKGNKYEYVVRNKDFSFQYIGFQRQEIEGISFLPANWKIGNLLSSENNSYAEDYLGFVITNPSGLKYTFGAASDISETMSATSPGILFPPSGLESFHEAASLEVDYYKISKNTWHLGKIDDPATNRTVYFDYEQYQKDTKETDYSYFDDTHGNLSNFFGDFLAYVPNYFRSLYPPPVHENFAKRQKSYVKYPRLNRIKKISFDSGEVIFEYNISRNDIPGQKALSRIIIKDNNNRTIKTVEFEYSYFTSGNGCNWGDCVRLKLDRVIFKDRYGDFVYDYDLEYHNPNSIPKVKSFQQDFLGYYNANGVNPSSGQLVLPRLYFAEGNGRFSISPFPFANQNYQVLNSSGYSILPNPNTCFYGALKKIKYPSGGWSEFEYESHKFRYAGNDYFAGGARIKKQILDDGEGNRYHKNYSYLNEQLQSSGSINNLPVYGALLTRVSGQNSFLVYGKSKTSLELTSGSFVGYSRIVEELTTSSGTSKGETIYRYASPKDYPNEYANLVSAQGDSGQNIDPLFSYVTNNSNYPYVGYIDNDIRRGKLLETSVFNSNGNILSKQTREYFYRDFPSEQMALNFKKQINNYREFAGQPYNSVLTFSSEINIEQNMLDHVAITEYFDNSQSLTSETFYGYDNDYPFVIFKNIVGPDGNNRFENVYYPFSPVTYSNPFMADLRDQNRLLEPIMEQQRTLYNTPPLSTTVSNFHNFGNGIIGSKGLSTAKGTLNLETESVITKRDQNSNVTEYRTRDGKYTSLIWGYNRTYPIAIIEGARIDQVDTWLDDEFGQDISYLEYLSGQDINYASEVTLRTWLNNLRTAVYQQSNSDIRSVMTYTYDPLIGLTSSTDQKGDTHYYVYDGFNRLKYVRDRNNKVLSKNEYHYNPNN